MLLFVTGQFTRVDAKAAYRYYQGSPESAAPSWPFSAALPLPSGLDSIYRGNLEEDWKFDANDGDRSKAGH